MFFHNFKYRVEVSIQDILFIILWTELDYEKFENHSFEEKAFLSLLMMSFTEIKFWSSETLLWFY